MGIYLLVIAGVDLQFRGEYAAHEQAWRSSVLCQLAGFMSTLSSELSVLTLTGMEMYLKQFICARTPNTRLITWNFKLYYFFLSESLINIMRVTSQIFVVYMICVQIFKLFKTLNFNPIVIYILFKHELNRTVITVDRLLVIKFPFGDQRLDMRVTRAVMATVWVVVTFLAALPLSSIPYFDNFYGRWRLLYFMIFYFYKPGLNFVQHYIVLFISIHQ